MPFFWLDSLSMSALALNEKNIKRIRVQSTVYNSVYNKNMNQQQTKIS